MNKQELNDLKIISKTELEQAKDEFGYLLRKIEYFTNNQESSKRADILRIMKSTLEFRDTLNKL